MNTPKLRFKEFSGEWEENLYGDIYTFYSTNSFPRDKLNYEDGEVYNIHYGDIHTKFSTLFKLEDEYVPYVNKDINLSKIKDENYCKVGDLVIADASEDYADIGKTMEIISLNSKKTLAGLHTFLARPNKDIVALGYMAYMLQSWNIRWQVMRISQGTKVLSLATSRLSKVILNLPKKPEQTKIAKFLTSTDKKIEQLSKKITLLQSYKKGLMQKIFSQEIRFKADDGSLFGEWEEKKFKDIFERVRRKNKENNLNVLTISAQQGLINQQKYFTKSISAKDVTGYYLIHKDEFAYNKSYSKGYPMGAIKKLNRYEKGVVSTLYICFKAINDDVSFLEQVFNNGNLNKELHKIAQEGARNHGLLNMSVVEFFNDMYLTIPCIAEQQKIANFLSSIDTKIQQTQKQLEATQAFKKALLQQMFV